METFSALLALCAGNSLVTGEFPSQRPVMWSFDVFFDLHPNKRLCNGEASDLRYHHAHYDITVIKPVQYTHYWPLLSPWLLMPWYQIDARHQRLPCLLDLDNMVEWIIYCNPPCEIKAINTLRPRQDGWHSAEDIFKCIFFNKNCGILIQIFTEICTHASN